jgi:hypothetical protein
VPTWLTTTRTGPLTGAAEQEPRPLQDTTMWGVHGVDEGVSVIFQDRTYIYFGDVAPNPQDPDYQSSSTSTSSRGRANRTSIRTAVTWRAVGRSISPTAVSRAVRRLRSSRTAVLRQMLLVVLLSERKNGCWQVHV